MSDQPDTIDQLSKRLSTLEQQIGALERRVDTLEHPLAARWPHPGPETETIPLTNPPGATLAQAGGIFPLLGRAMLGVAGAYLLRALAETGTLPRMAVAWAGIIYAFLWLVWAARSRNGTSLASLVYACTSALILAPMLWELTLRFKLLPPPVTAGVLGAYALAALALARKLKLASVFRVGTLAAAALSLALAIASHDLLPFTALLLALVALIEFRPWRDRAPETQALVALAADAAIWMLIFTYFSAPAAHADYPQIGEVTLLSPGIAVFLIAAAGIILQTVVRQQKIGIFATVQATTAFLLFAVSLADFGPPSSLALFGILCLLLAAAGYAAVLTILTDARTSTVFAAWSAALLFSGCQLCFAPLWDSLCLGIAAIVATFLGRQKNSISFELYGFVFLTAAAAESGLLSFIGHFIIANRNGLPGTAAWLIAACAILCYAAARPCSGERWQSQSVHLGVAALALGALIAFIVQALVSLVALKTIPGAHHLAFIRTLTLCSAALALVFGGARWRRIELTRLANATLAVVALKLVAEDIRHGHLAYIAGSIFLFAVTLIAAPRVAHARDERRESTSISS